MLSRLDCCWRPKRRQIIRIRAQQNLSESTQKIIILNVTGIAKKKRKGSNGRSSTWTNWERRRLKINWGNIENRGDKLKEDGLSFWKSPNREQTCINALSSHLIGSNSAFMKIAYCELMAQWLKYKCRKL